MTEPGAPATAVAERVAELIAELKARTLTLAVAESLTGGLLAATIVDVPGASTVFNGGVVAYATELKHDLVGVDEDLLEARGPVDPTVAGQLADRVRTACAVGGRPADVGIGATGVAGPEWQGGRPPGTVFVAVATAAGVRAEALRLDGGRPEVRRATVEAAVALALDAVRALPGAAE